MEAILFLIGMQETGFMPEKISKEQKQDLMHVAVCTVLMPGGYYKMTDRDADGWPVFDQLKEYKALTLLEQENLLKDHILFYFQQQQFI